MKLSFFYDKHLSIGPFGNHNSTKSIIALHLPTRFADILEQIELINPMIELHADNPSMRDQYVELKQRWVD